jgi:pimeloyl-ACP methyl ester carboxylesterase
VAALGSSMGAAALCYAAEFQLSWRAMVLEGIYRDIGSAFARRIGSDYPAWFGRLYPGVVRVTERRLGLRLEQLTPLAHVGRLGDVPILFITGMNDRFAPPADAEQVAAQCRGPRDLWVVPNAGHSDVFDKGGEVYQNQVTAFFRKWMT